MTKNLLNMTELSQTPPSVTSFQNSFHTGEILLVQSNKNMDPLSISASVTALAGAVGFGLKGLRKLYEMKDSPKEVSGLIREVTHLKLTVPI